MQLLYQTHSPYARKVLVLAHETRLAARMEVIHHETSPTRRNQAVYDRNPLGKVPVLIDGALVLFDSTVISEHLDALHDGRRRIPANGEKRLLALRMQALAQGLCEAGIAMRWEIERRPEHLRWPVMREAQAAKLNAAYNFIENEAELDSAFNLGEIALATALDWIAFRNLPDFREGRPRLAAWFDEVTKRPSMQATTMHGETQD